MKYKKREVLEVVNTIKLIEEFVERLPDIYKLNDKFKFAFMRTVLRSTSISKEREAIEKLLWETFIEYSKWNDDKIDEDKVKSDEEYNKATNKKFAKWLSEKEDNPIKDFLEEDVEFEFFKVDFNELATCSIPSKIIGALNGYIID